ncbi:hypothetical protein GCM10027089_12130 [Nocardia thraciensis]
MVLARGWTGFEAIALQTAIRLSVREFAALLEVDPKTVTNWRANGRSVVPRFAREGTVRSDRRRRWPGSRCCLEVPSVGRLDLAVLGTKHAVGS